MEHRMRWLLHQSCRTAPYPKETLRAFLFSLLNCATVFLLLCFHHVPQVVNLPVGLLTGIHRIWGKNWRPVELKLHWGVRDQRTTLTKLLHVYSKSSFLGSYFSYSKHNQRSRTRPNPTFYSSKEFGFCSCLCSFLPCSSKEPVLTAIHQHSWHRNSPDAKLWILIFFSCLL